MMFCSGFKRARKAKLSISWYFLSVGAILGNWSSILPAVKNDQNVSNLELGLILVAAVFGAILAVPVVTEISKRYGCGLSLFLGGIVMLLLYPIVSIKHNLIVFTIGVFLLGFGAGWSDISMNSQAVLCEKMIRSRSLGLFHSIFAVGGLIGAFLGGALLQRGFTIFENITLVCIILLLPQIFLSCWLFSHQEENLINSNIYNIQAEQEKDSFSETLLSFSETFFPNRNPESDKESLVSKNQSSDSSDRNKSNPTSSVDSDWKTYESPNPIEPTSPKTLLISISILCFLSYFGEGSVSDWSAIFLSNELHCNSMQSSLGLIGYEFCIAVSTYYSDAMSTYFGRRKLLQISGFLAFGGLSLVVIAPLIKINQLALFVSILGFSISGIGLSVVPPTVISLAGSGIVGVDSHDAIGIVSSVGYFGFMIGPPLLGGLSELFGSIRWSFLVDGIMLCFISIISFYIHFPEALHSTRESDCARLQAGNPF